MSVELDPCTIALCATKAELLQNSTAQVSQNDDASAAKVFKVFVWMRAHLLLVSAGVFFAWGVVQFWCGDQMARNLQKYLKCCTCLAFIGAIPSKFLGESDTPTITFEEQTKRTGRAGAGFFLGVDLALLGLYGWETWLQATDNLVKAAAINDQVSSFARALAEHARGLADCSDGELHSRSAMMAHFLLDVAIYMDNLALTLPKLVK